MLDAQTALQANVQIERCVTELQRGRAIILIDDHDASNSPPHLPRPMPSLHMVHLIETLEQAALEQLLKEHACKLIISRTRASALDVQTDDNAVCIELPASIDSRTVQHWAGRVDSQSSDRSYHASTLSSPIHTSSILILATQAVAATQSSLTPSQKAAHLRLADATLNLAQHAHALPAFIAYPVKRGPSLVLAADSTAAANYTDNSGNLMLLSRTHIPLEYAENVQLIVFRERHGHAEHVAIVVGEPDFSHPTTVRVHSSCFTGDILGSLKCDCGEQLKHAIRSMNDKGGGVVLYLSQEGRGIGLSSKLMAYQLQDQGLDTIEANRHLGFDADERQYSAAVSMLQALGLQRIHLMTNNPLKIEALRQHGIEVQTRIPSPATVNHYNARYLQTKRERAGHLLA